MRWDDDHERQVGKDMEGSSHDILEDTIPAFSWRDWRESWETLVSIPSNPADVWI